MYDIGRRALESHPRVPELSILCLCLLNFCIFPITTKESSILVIWILSCDPIGWLSFPFMVHLFHSIPRKTFILLTLKTAFCKTH